VKHVISMVVGFGLGQGAMFFVSTWLVLIGDFKLLADLGIMLGLLGLFQWIGDWGGVYLFPKQMEKGGFDDFFKKFMLARLFLSLIIVSLFIVVAAAIDLPDFYKLVMIYSLATLLIWSLNIAGVIDALGLNSKVGFYSGLNWMLSAATVFLFYGSENLIAIIGLAFLLGTLITLFIQFLVSKGWGWCSGFCYIDIDIDFEVVWLSFRYNLLFAIGQIYGRALLILVDYMAGPSVSGVFVYVKQIYNACGQVVIFARRVEYKNVVGYVGVDLGFSPLGLIWVQRKGGYISFLGIILSLLVFCAAFYFGVDDVFVDLLWNVFLFSCVLFLWYLATSLSQGVIALGKLGFQIAVVTSSSIVGLLSIFLMGRFLSVENIAFVEAIMFSVQFFIYYIYLSGVRR